MVVGDEDQSIYGFRGADIRNILDFEDDFPDAEVVKLEQNYRSTQTILSAANAVDRPQPRAARRSSSGPSSAGASRSSSRELDDEHAEARFVAGEIERLGRRGGRARARTSRSSTGPTRRPGCSRTRWSASSSPYQVIGGTKFYERAEIKDAVAYLSLLVNPADQVSLHADRQLAAARDRQTPARARLASHANTTGRADLGGRGGARGGARAWAPRRSRRSRRFHATMEGLRERAEARRRSPSCSRRLLRETGYLEALEAERTIEAEGRIENLEELVGVAAEFDANRELEGESEVRRWRSSCSRSRSSPSRTTLRDDERLVTLMTLHNAKGLEYTIVFIIGCEDGVFPHSRSLDEGGVEEERRLCYVGITRATRAST